MESAVELISWTEARDHMGELTRAFFDYCLSIRESDRLPRLADFDIIDVARRNPRIVSHVWILSVGDDATRFEYRLMGEAIREAGSGAKAGDPVEQFDESGSFTKNLRKICEMGAPRFYRGPPMLEHDRQISALEIVQVPFTRDRTRVSDILNCTVYYWQPGYRPTS